MNRRNLLTIAAMLPIGYVVQGCAPGSTPTVSIADALAGIQALDAEAQVIYQQLVAAGLKVGSSTANTIQAILSQVQTAAQSLTAANAATVGQSVLAQIEGYFNALAPLVAPFVKGGGSVILQIVLAAMPAIEVGFNLLVSLLTPQAKALAAKPSSAPGSAAPGAEGMPAPSSPEQALQQLISIAAMQRGH